MTIKECYEKIGGNYDEVLRRMMKEERILKFLKMFLQDPTFQTLCQEMDNQNYPEAFRAAHTLKGLCQNMAFTWLNEPTVELTECLRDGTMKDGALEYLAQVKERYQVTCEEIQKL